MTWSLTTLLAKLHEDIERRLATARETFAHAPTKGDASEHIWLDLMNTYLPERYKATTAHVVDSKGAFSDQIDVVIFDRQYSPFIFKFEEQSIIPAESVYAVFESKQVANAPMIKYARAKASTVRKLSRTSLPIPHAGGVYEAKTPGPILAGLLSFESDWRPPLGDALVETLGGGDATDILDIGCIASHGIFYRTKDKTVLSPEKKPATAFLLELIAKLQELGTVPMIDTRAYAQWLEK